MSWRRVSRMPMTTVLPLVVSAAILLVSLSLSVVSVMLLKNFVNATLEQKASVYLHGFAGHIAQSEPFDPALTQSALVNALRYPSPLGESSVAIGRIEAGQLVVQIYPEPDDKTLAETRAALQQALARGANASMFSYHDGEDARLTTVYALDDHLFALSALFDARDAATTNKTTIEIAVVVNVLLVLVSIIITFLVARRVAYSLRAFSRRLSAEHEDAAMPASGSELATLEGALVAREHDEAQRSKALELMAQSERDALLGRVAAVIAHEVRNPLAGILGALSTLRRFGDDKTVREETLGIVESGLNSLRRIADVTLATYRRRGEQKMIHAPDIEDLELLIAPEARKKGLRLNWRLDQVNGFVTDADAIRQITVNLLLNACKASPEHGTIDIALTVSGNEARLSVSDHGPGLPSSVLEYLRAGPTSEVLPSSRELGVSVICAMVEDIGASLSVDSRPDEGTTITVIIPQAPSLHTAPDEPKSS